jgi:hypothetical protein
LIVIGVSVVIALFDGPAMQWLLEPARLPGAAQVVRALQGVASTVSEEAAPRG